LSRRLGNNKTCWLSAGTQAWESWVPPAPQAALQQSFGQDNPHRAGSVPLLCEMIRTTLTSAVKGLCGLESKAAGYGLLGGIKKMCGAPSNQVCS